MKADRSARTKVRPKARPKARAKAPPGTLGKALTGIAGFDAITGGGLPRGRTTLLVGGPGSGKTLFALQFLVQGARDAREPGIFVAFEEASTRVVANAESFGWKLAELRRREKIAFLDAQPGPDLIQSGTFDLGGLLANLLQDEVVNASHERPGHDQADNREYHPHKWDASQPAQTRVDEEEDRYPSE